MEAQELGNTALDISDTDPARLRPDLALDGARVVVLGGTSGLGYAVAAAAARDGADIVVVSSRQARVNAAVGALSRMGAATGRAAEGHALDLADEAEVQELFARIGPFDHLVYTAGDSLMLHRVAETDLAAARGFMDVRLWGAFAAVKYARAVLRPGGSIVLTTGTAGRRPQAGWAVAAMLCSAIEGLTRALAVELAPIRVNAVSPGAVRTPLWRDMPEQQREAMWQSLSELLPVGRVGEAEDIAQAYLFLMRERHATGQVIVVDGGGVLV